ncbi:Crp/Fnr family transcriptional regulator [Chitinophagaceae bacterium LB-8]|uniref:Crp/Fnr family transcriptional regulator n=1 Tax=Paraflavisolibacter caeni TaxID=2982496 RepID=A0A9X2XY56_9BACT|nr:Crp/Fnr family transcriptional regulator [Paraflavisolibacter caeni]MCU7550900.1 Crp/Fnr family transcriptional regulator [Paraflavisolibacter caeni]
MASGQAFIENLINILDIISEQRTISKGEFLIREGQIEKNLYYIETGAVRVFHLSEFEEQTIRFGYEGSFINSLYSFIKGTPSEFYIEALRKSTLRVISKGQLLDIVNESNERLKQYNSLLETLVCQQIEREIDLLTVSPSERLRRVLERSPNLFQEIPLKYIASYLRMTPETLSRIRNS